MLFVGRSLSVVASCLLFADLLFCCLLCAACYMVYVVCSLCVVCRVLRILC